MLLAWLRSRRERIEHMETEAYALIYDFGVGAYAEARKREREANDFASMRYWSRVALAVARNIDKQVRPDPAARIAADGVFLSYAERSASAQSGPVPPIDQPEEPEPIVPDHPRAQFRLQFMALTRDDGLTVVGEVGIRASDVSGAIRQTFRVAWPPRAAGFRLIDQEGREVFARQQNRHASSPRA